ncbi:MAG: DNA repair protein RecN [Deltaproteobacteria bacterium]|nr:DNA repair protein RecN [Deltaproteobacteria bacterium]
MLSELKVKNLALIEHLSLSFGPGANLLTGETGAGKSILAGALGLLKGQKAQAGLVRSGAEEAEVEALFHLENPLKLAGLFEAQGLEPSDEIVLRRQVSAASGRNRIRINGTLIPLSSLVQWGDELLAIASQHDQQSLTSPARQMDFLDAFAGHGDLLTETLRLWREQENAAAALRELEEELAGNLEKKDLFIFQLEEIKKTAPQPDEDLTLMEQKNRHRSGAKQASLLSQARELLETGQDSLLARLDRLRSFMARASQTDESWLDTAESIQKMVIELDDLAKELRSPDRTQTLKDSDLEDLEVRLNDLAKLKRKYGPALEDVLSRAAKIQQTLDRLAEAGLETSRLKKILDRARKAASEQAGKLTQSRLAAAGRLAQNLEETLKVLGFPRIQLKIEISPAAQPGPKGHDQVSFLFCPNPGEGLRPLAKIASGGELSRLMLALKIAQEPRSDQSLVFDEIDAGLSGATAEAVAGKMAELAGRQQIFIITHLPQMASLAGRHFLVFKQIQDSDRTVTSIQELEDGGRVQELSRMLGGASPSEEAVALSHKLLGL